VSSLYLCNPTILNVCTFDVRPKIDCSIHITQYLKSKNARNHYYFLLNVSIAFNVLIGRERQRQEKLHDCPTMRCLNDLRGGLGSASASGHAPAMRPAAAAVIAWTIVGQI
jgi:hypothetical protein